MDHGIDHALLTSEDKQHVICNILGSFMCHGHNDCRVDC